MRFSTSPSVYVVYSGIVASASCVAHDLSVRRIGEVRSTILPYKTEELSSIACPRYLATGDGIPLDWEPINFDDLIYGVSPERSSSSIEACFGTETHLRPAYSDYMMNPFISIPQDVSKIDPVW